MYFFPKSLLHYLCVSLCVFACMINDLFVELQVEKFQQRRQK